MSLLKQVELFRIQSLEQRGRVHSGGCSSRRTLSSSVSVKCTYSSYNQQPGQQQNPDPNPWHNHHPGQQQPPEPSLYNQQPGQNQPPPYSQYNGQHQPGQHQPPQPNGYSTYNQQAIQHQPGYYQPPEPNVYNHQPIQQQFGQWQPDNQQQFGQRQPDDQQQFGQRQPEPNFYAPYSQQPVPQQPGQHQPPSPNLYSTYNQPKQQLQTPVPSSPYNQPPGPPEPDFNDISGLSDLADISTDPNAPRFVPTFSRVARRGFAKRYELFPGGPIDTSTDQEPQENGLPHVPEEIMDLPKGPTHKEMIAARRHYLKRQARRGLLPPSRPIRKRFPLDDSF